MATERDPQSGRPDAPWSASARRSGLVLGRFLPPHRGHEYLLDVAARTAAPLTVLVIASPDDPVPGALRVEWVRALAPGAQVAAVDIGADERPMPGDPGFVRRWVDRVRAHVPEGPAWLIGSDDGGLRLAEHLGATYVPVDPRRLAVPVSSTVIRLDPIAHWAFLAPCVRPYVVRRVCIVGAAATGKSTLAQTLAAHYRTAWVPEYARVMTEELAVERRRLGPADVVRVAVGQITAEDALATHAERLLLCDTGLDSIVAWSEALFGDCPAWVRDEAAARAYDLYLVCAPDPALPDDPDAIDPARARIHARLLELLEPHRAVVILDGPAATRRVRALAAVDKLLLGRELLAARHAALGRHA